MRQSDKPLIVQQQEKFLQVKCFFLESSQISLHVGLSSVLIHPSHPLHVEQHSRYLQAWVGSQSYYNNPCEMLDHHHKHHPQDTIVHVVLKHSRSSSYPSLLLHNETMQLRSLLKTTTNY